MFEGELDQMSMEFPYYLYHRNPTGWEFFVPAMTLLAVKLLTTNEAVSEGSPSHRAYTAQHSV
jgi:hypothetical protein